MSAITFRGWGSELLSNNLYNLYCLLSISSISYSLNNCLGSLSCLSLSQLNGVDST